MSYLAHAATKNLPVTEQMRADQVKNSDGGYVWAVDDWTRLNRFLIMGSEGGSYYIGEKKLTKENAAATMKCIKSDGFRVVDEVVRVSEAGRAPSNDPALFVLAMAASHGGEATRQYAFDNLSKVARIGTHLFHFVGFCKLFRGWGRAMRRGVAAWYEEMDVDRLAFQAVKYKGRDGWTHRDVLRLAHPKTDDKVRNEVFKYMTGNDWEPIMAPSVLINSDRATAGTLTASEIAEYNLPREVIDTKQLNDPEVWDALLQNMPMTAMIRNLGKMTNVGLLKPMSKASKMVCARLQNTRELEGARIHPISVLAALVTYQAGHGYKGSLTWSPVAKIIDALDEAFYLSFGNVVPTGARTMLCLDVSGSMNKYGVNGMPFLNCKQAAAAMAMSVVRTEEDYMTVGFGGTVQSIYLSPKLRLDTVVNKMNQLSFGWTDMSLAVRYALDNKLDIDVFQVFTDNEVNHGKHPAGILQEYRDKTGINAKFAVWGMASNGFTVADPSDYGMMDIAGLDAAAPVIVNDWIRGEI